MGQGWGWLGLSAPRGGDSGDVVNGQDQKSPQVGNLELETNGQTYLR